MTWKRWHLPVSAITNKVLHAIPGEWRAVGRTAARGGLTSRGGQKNKYFRYGCYGGSYCDRVTWLWGMKVVEVRTARNVNTLWMDNSSSGSAGGPRPGCLQHLKWSLLHAMLPTGQRGAQLLQRPGKTLWSLSLIGKIANSHILLPRSMFV